MSDDRLQSIEAEQWVLGSMLLDGDCAKKLLAKLRPDDFALDLNRRIYRSIAKLTEDGKSPDALLVAEDLGAGSPKQKEIRGYLAQLLEITVTTANAEEYADIVLERAGRRQLRTALTDALTQLDAGAPEETILPALEAAADRQRERAVNDLLTPEEQIDRFYQRRELIDAGMKPYVRTGFRSLDRMLSGGLQNSGLYFLAGRPGMGKTTLALAIAEYAANTAGPTLYITLEMSDQQLTSKRVSAIAKIKYADIISDTLTEEEYRRVANAARTIGATPLTINRRMTATVSQISMMARGNRGFHLVVIDHFSLIRTPGRQDRAQEYTYVSNALKRLAISMGVPVLVLAQLNRENERRTDKRPMLSDLRETGAAEQDADGIILLHRPDYYDKDSPERDENMPVLVEAHVAKNRHGATGKVDLSFYLKSGNFRERYVK